MLTLWSSAAPTTIRECCHAKIWRIKFALNHFNSLFSCFRRRRCCCSCASVETSNGSQKRSEESPTQKRNVLQISMQYAHNDDEDDGKEESAERVNAKELSRKRIRINKPRTNRAGVCRRVAVVVGAATVCDDARSPSAYVATSLSMAAEAELSQALLLLYSGSEAKNHFICKWQWQKIQQQNA